MQARRRDGLIAGVALILLGITILILSGEGIAQAVGAGFTAGGLAGILVISLISRFTRPEDPYRQQINEQMTQIAQNVIRDVSSAQAFTPVALPSASESENDIRYWRKTALLMGEHLETHHDRLNDSTFAALEQARKLAEDRADQISDQYRRRFGQEPWH